jgi:hypothetical protein
MRNRVNQQRENLLAVDKPHIKTRPALINGPAPLKRGGSQRSAQYMKGHGREATTPRLGKFQQLEVEMHDNLSKKFSSSNNDEGSDNSMRDSADSATSSGTIGGGGGGGGGNTSNSFNKSEEEIQSSHKGLLGALEQLGDEWQVFVNMYM